ncbi:MAG: DUF1549 and DUF1553 domain-containing protein, partial [Verrucomicrobiota bacterium]
MKILLAALILIPAAAGAEHWAFQPIERPNIPEGEHSIDFFVNRKLDELGFEPTPKADHATLSRRAFYYLIGLPPNDFETEYESLIDNLLSSPHYGERWARHWLDVARYADTKDGVLMYGDNRIRPFAYTYRDYVIRAFNADKPYDQFVREQLAADQLGLNDELAAMGFLTLGRMFDNNRYDVIDDQIDVVTRGLMGLTVSCARCHDHKYDPIPTADYYSLYGVFSNSETPIDRPVVESIRDNGIENQYAEKAEELLKLRKEKHQQLVEAAKEKTADYIQYAATTEPTVSETSQFFLSLQPEDLRPQIISRWRDLLKRKPEIRQLQDRLADEFHTFFPNERPPWEFPISQTWYYMSRKDKEAYRGKANALDIFATQSNSLAGRAMSLVDSPEIVEPVIFNRGNPSEPGNSVERRFLSILDNKKTFRRGSGRLELANAIVDPENPLTARVIVNRIWMHHFGKPLVETPSDFGIRTTQPSHPELLDYLASELIDNGWRLKPIHKLIMSSQTYQRSSLIPDSEPFKNQQLQDPENRLLWKGNRRRLDLESMRDTILAMSGQLDARMFGRPLPINSSSNNRRTIYALVERQNSPEIFRVFDFANPDVSCAQRNHTTVPQQA